MSDQQKFQGKKKAKTLLNSPKFKFTTQSPIKGVKDRPDLSFFAGGDNPGITVNTRDPNDKDYNFGRIQAKMGFSDFGEFVEMLHAVQKLDPGNYLNMKCRAKYDSKGNQLEKPDFVTNVIVGKRNDGAIYVVLEDLTYPNRPKIPFVLAPNYWHQLELNGQRMTEADCSVHIANSLARQLNDIVNKISVETYEHREPNFGGGGGRGGNFNGGGRGGYNGGGNGGGGGYQQQQQQQQSRPAPEVSGGDDDDVPY